MRRECEEFHSFVSILVFLDFNALYQMGLAINKMFQSLFSWILTRRGEMGEIERKIISILVFLDFNGISPGNHNSSVISILVFLDFN